MVCLRGGGGGTPGVDKHSCPLALQATVFSYSKDWQQVAADMRSRIAGGAGRQAGRAGTCQQGPTARAGNAHCLLGTVICCCALNACCVCLRLRLLWTRPNHSQFVASTPLCSHVHIGLGINNAKLCGEGLHAAEGRAPIPRTQLLSSGQAMVQHTAQRQILPLDIGSSG